ncbi:MAG: hypothetical protein HQL41_02165 [Alphaproteobacteria bacterium]|nr:hypothetical protein [Alphaproteobacteria bacterium]
MSRRSGDDARRDLGPHFPELARLLDEAYREFLEKTREFAHKLETGTKASIIRDLSLRRLREYCDTAPGAHFFKKGNLSLICFNNNWVLRIKQLRSGFKVAVSPTGSSKAYDRNELPTSMASLLPTEPPATCLYLGWAVPENAPSRIQKFVVCNNEFRELDWALPLDEDGPTPPERLPLPEPPEPPAERNRVRVKEEKKRRANE